MKRSIATLFSCLMVLVLLISMGVPAMAYESATYNNVYPQEIPTSTTGHLCADPLNMSVGETAVLVGNYLFQPAGTWEITQGKDVISFADYGDGGIGGNLSSPKATDAHTAIRALKAGRATVTFTSAYPWSGITTTFLINVSGGGVEYARATYNQVQPDDHSYGDSPVAWRRRPLVLKLGETAVLNGNGRDVQYAGKWEIVTGQTSLSFAKSKDVGRGAAMILENVDAYAQDDIFASVRALAPGDVLIKFTPRWNGRPLTPTFFYIRCVAA